MIKNINDSQIKLFGRYYKKDGGYCFDNVSSGIEVNFIGSKFIINTKTFPKERINPLYPMFTVLSVQVDDNNPFRLDVKNEEFQNIVLVSNLANEKHSIRLLKTDDPLISSLCIKNIEIDGEFLPPSNYKYNMEVYGDSISSGGDNLIGDGPSLDVVPGTGDGTLTFATIAARKINAHVNVFSRCGICLYGASSSDQDIVVSKIFNKCSATTLVDWDMNKFVPDIIVINLGTNDELGNLFSYSNFKNSMKTFVLKLKEIYKKDILFILTHGYMDKKIELENAIKDTVFELKKDVKIDYLKFPKAKIGHPSVEEHTAGAVLLETVINRNLLKTV